MSTIPSTNMNMPVPVVGEESGPQWATDLNSCLAILDGHNHAPGYGVQITPAGMNISTDLTYLQNNATNLRSVRFFAQPNVLALAADLGCIYEAGVDLYYNDGVGNQIRITQSGGLAGSPGSISNLNSPASASYVSGNATFVWQSAVNTPANLDAASILLRNLSVNSKALTLAPPAAMSSNYALTLPALPASTSFLVMNNTGTITAQTVFPLTTTGIASSTILGSNIATATVAKSNMVALGQQISGSTGGTTITSTTWVDVTNLSVTLTTVGRPVYVQLQAADGGDSRLIATSTSSQVLAQVRIVRIRVSDSTTNTICTQYIGNFIDTSPPTVDFVSITVPSSSISHIDVPPLATTWQYKVQCQIAAGVAGALNFQQTTLVAWEL